MYTFSSDPATSIILLCSSATEYISLLHSSQSHSFSKLSFLPFIYLVPCQSSQWFSFSPCKFCAAVLVISSFCLHKITTVYYMSSHLFSSFIILPHVTELRYCVFVMEESNRPYLPSIRVLTINCTWLSTK